MLDARCYVVRWDITSLWHSVNYGSEIDLVENKNLIIAIYRTLNACILAFKQNKHCAMYWALRFQRSRALITAFRYCNLGPRTLFSCRALYAGCPLRTWELINGLGRSSALRADSLSRIFKLRSERSG